MTASIRPTTALPVPAPHGFLPVYTLEITTPTGQPTTPLLPGWTAHVWPVARLGDATLQIQALYSHLTETDLRRALHAAGYAALGPVRAHQ